MHKVIRADLRPAYYDDFHCLAADCKRSCCIGWRITFDKKDYLSLKRLSGSAELNRRMEHGLRRIRHDDAVGEDSYGEFTMEGECCPLLREDCLCALQLEKGHGALPYVCQSFPRRETYQPSGYFERSLSPACEAVMKLFWNRPEGIDFRSDPLPKEEWKSVTWEDDGILSSHFQEIRSQCIDFLQDRSRPLPQRILLLGLALKKLADGEQNVPHWLIYARSLQEHDNPILNTEDSHALPLFLSNNLQVLLTLKNPNPQFADIPKKLMDALELQFQSGTFKAAVSSAPYLMARERFERDYAGREYLMENLVTALFFHLHLPNLFSKKSLWKSYVNFCNLFSFYRFMAVMSCREGASGDRDELFHLLVFASRSLLHDHLRQTALRDELFQNDSASLAHMAILVSG